MILKEIPKSELLKNISINDKDKYSNQTNLSDNDKPVDVEDKGGQYFVIDGIDRLMNAHLSRSGDDMIHCRIINK